MGEVYLDLTIANIEDRRHQKEISFLVDPGASRAWISQQVAKELKIKPVGTVSLELANGIVKKFPYGACCFRLNREIVAGNVFIGSQDTRPSLGTHVLQDFRLVIDMEHHTVSRRRAMKAKCAELDGG